MTVELLPQPGDKIRFTFEGVVDEHGCVHVAGWSFGPNRINAAERIEIVERGQ